MELIDRAALVAEIEKYKVMAKPSYYGCGRVSVCEDLIKFLDTLEVKEVDLDYIKKELDELIHKPNGDFGWGTLYDVATHFFKLGLKVKGK